MSSGASNHHDGIRLDDVIGLVRRRRRTVGITALVVFVGTFLWLGTRTPVYRASATVLIDEDGGENGLLSELAAIGKAPAAASEIAILSSRSIAEQAVRRPSGTDIPTPSSPGIDRHLGLETRVDDARLRPLATLVARIFGSSGGDGELHAWVDERGSTAPQEVQVDFVGERRVKLSRPSFLPGITPGSDAEHLDLPADGSLEYRGLRLRLLPEGDVEGMTFLVRHDTPDEAIRRIRSNTRAMETERASGVVRVTVNDSDPERAARIADALCLNYFDLNVARGSKRASQTVEFIDEQLEEQLHELREAEIEVVELRKANPETIDVTATASVLIDRLSTLEVQRVQLSMTRTALTEAIALIEAGELDALSRLGEEVSDGFSLGYVAQITQLTGELELIEREGVGPYRLLLHRKLAELRDDLEELELRTVSLRSVVEGYAAGDDGAIAALSGQAQEGYGGGPMTVGYLERISTLQAECAELEQTYTDEFPPLVEKREAIANMRRRVLEQLEGKLAALEQLHDEQSRLVDEAQDVLERHPIEEREKIETALTNLRGRVLEHVKNRLDGVETARNALDEEIDSIEANLGELPEKERLLADPVRRLETHSEIVQFLLKSKQDAEIARAATVATADFIDPAEPPILRYAPRVGFTLVLGLLLGIAAGLGVAYLRENLKGTIHTEADLETASDLPVLGSIPDFSRGSITPALRGASFLALRDDPDGPVAEAYRSLRANLRFALGGDREIRTLAVTSCTPGEGKSVTNADLAIAFANGNKRVLLVDADMRKPTVHKSFVVDRAPGLAEVLQEGLDWRSHVQDSGIENLDLLAAGVHRGKPGDLLARPGIGELVDSLASEYDVVVFDLPPALVVADVESFAHKLDAMLLLYRADSVSRDAVRTASARLRQTGSNLVGAVLNAVRAEHGKGGGYYHSYYEYEETETPLKKGA